MFCSRYGIPKSICIQMIKKKKRMGEIISSILFLLRRKDSNLRPLGYGPNELPLLHSAMFLTCECKGTLLFLDSQVFSCLFVCPDSQNHYFCNLLGYV